MARPYNRLRRLMRSRGVSIYDIAKVFGVTGATVSNKLRGVTDWRLSECWAVMELLGISAGDMAGYFPEGGHNE